MFRGKGWLLRDLLGLPDPSIKTIILILFFFAVVSIVFKLTRK
jgi:hypothetical protein